MLEWWLAPWAPRGGRVFVDVGANVGTWTRYLAPNFTHGYAIEPDPDALAVLRTEVPENVTIHAVGAWHAETTLTFSRFAETVHTSAFFTGNGINTGPRRGTVELPCRPLDALGIDDRTKEQVYQRIVVEVEGMGFWKSNFRKRFSFDQFSKADTVIDLTDIVINLTESGGPD